MYDEKIDSLIPVLIQWAKESDRVLTDSIITQVEECFEYSGANNRRTVEDRKACRTIVARGIIIKCLYALNTKETARLENELFSMC